MDPKLPVSECLVRCKSIPDLLSGFDLSPCRVAIDQVNDYMYVSTHCMAAVFSGRYYLPTAAQHESSFLKMLADAKLGDYAKICWDRLDIRVKKYLDRGFVLVTQMR